MKYFFLIILLTSCTTEAQKRFVPSHGYGKGEYVIVQNDGKKIKANNIEFDADDAWLQYKTPSDKGKLQYTEVKEITSAQNTVFRSFPAAKLHGGFVIAENDSRILVAMAFSNISRTQGPDSSKYNHFMLSILDKSGKLIQEFDLGATGKKGRETGKAALDAISANFADCPNIMQFVTAWDTDENIGGLGGHFNATCAQKSCQ